MAVQLPGMRRGQRRQPGAGLVAVASALVFVIFPAVLIASPGQTDTASKIEFRDGCLAVAAANAPLARILEEVARQTKIEVRGLPARSGAGGLQPLPFPSGKTGVPILGTVSATCGASAGTRFNKELSLNALPQDEESVDFVLNGVSAGVDLVVGGANDFRGIFGNLQGATGYYVQRATADCIPEFDGALPLVSNPFATLATVSGFGDPVVAADPGRGAFYMADLRFDFTFGISVTGIGVFRTTTATLMNTLACPNGTHTELQSQACWPTGTVVNPLPLPFTAFFQDKPHLTVDERMTGTGAGNVYVTGTEFDFFTNFSRIWIVSCKNNLTQCSSPTIISGSDTNTQFSHVAVRPDGGVTISYVQVDFDPNTFQQVFEIKFVACSAANAPATPSCSPATLVTSETQPLSFGGFLGAEDFRTATYPKHDHRVDANGTETYVVWDRCKVNPVILGFINTCGDADVLMSASKDGAGPLGLHRRL